MLLEQKPEPNSSQDGADILLEPYHYTNHYSNVATVLQFLVRLPPFTQLFIDFQGQKSLHCNLTICNYLSRVLNVQQKKAHSRGFRVSSLELLFNIHKSLYL